MKPGVQERSVLLNTSQMNIPEGLEVPWSDTLCKRALGQTFTNNVQECWGDSDAARMDIQTMSVPPCALAADSSTERSVPPAERPSPSAARPEDVLRLFSKIIAGFVERSGGAIAWRAVKAGLAGHARRLDEACPTGAALRRSSTASSPTAVVRVNGCWLALSIWTTSNRSTTSLVMKLVTR